MSDPNDFDYVVVGGRSAGNAVVFKPSEHTPGTGAWLVDTFAQVVPEQPVLQLVTGPGATGEALCRAGLDKIAFTSSAATRKQVMRACADGLVPVVIEGGGKDALLADATTSPPRPTRRSGAACPTPGSPASGSSGSTSTPRYDAFLGEVTTRVRDLRVGPGQKIGPMTTPAQPPPHPAPAQPPRMRTGQPTHPAEKYWIAGQCGRPVNSQVTGACRCCLAAGASGAACRGRAPRSSTGRLA